MTPQRLSRIVAAAVLLTLSPLGCSRYASRIMGGQSAGPVVSTTDPPVGTQTQGVQWIRIAAPGMGVMFAAVARPLGTGPFPTIIILHGTHGFGEQYVKLARDVSRGGLIAVAPCWFSGGRGAGASFITPIGCPEAPEMPSPSSPAAHQTLDAIVQAVRALPGVRPDRIALFGHSRGGGATLSYLLAAGTLQAVILNSTGYPRELDARASEIRVPILILHGTADSPADGGSAFTDIQMARDFEMALRRAGKQVEATYYEGGHNGIFSSATQYDDEVHRIVVFLTQRLFN